MSKEFPEKPKILITNEDLDRLGISQKDQKFILEKIDELVREGKLQTIGEAREIIPTLDVSQFTKVEKPSNKPDTPWQLKRQGKK